MLAELKCRRWLWQGSGLLLMVCLLGACTTGYPLVAERESIRQNLEPGSQVHVVTRDGRSRYFVVRQVTEEALVGDEVSIPYRDIESIERREIALDRTAGCLLGGLGVVVLAGYVLFQITGPDLD